MANMAYCRFSNTVRDLQDCYDHIDDDLTSDLTSDAELRAHWRLVTLCKQVAALFDDEADDALDEAEERIEDLEAQLTALRQDQLEIATELNDAGIEHSGHKAQAQRVKMMREKLRTLQHNVIHIAKERNDLRRRVAELEAQQEQTNG